MPTTVEVFRRYRGGGNVLVETGSYKGDGIQAALDAGFQRVISIEIHPLLNEMCRKRFAAQSNVSLVVGDSGLCLGKTLEDVKEKFVCWLDGHLSGPDSGKGFRNAPIVEELEHIRKHPFGSQATILIDDRRLMSKDEGLMVLETEITDKLKEINPNYHITYIDGLVPNDIIVASPS
jgi:hypothetical protein